MLTKRRLALQTSRLPPQPNDRGSQNERGFSFAHFSINIFSAPTRVLNRPRISSISTKSLCSIKDSLSHHENIFNHIMGIFGSCQCESRVFPRATRADHSRFSWPTWFCHIPAAKTGRNNLPPCQTRGKSACNVLIYEVDN